jgi:hypothetical protein
MFDRAEDPLAGLEEYEGSFGSIDRPDLVVLHRIFIYESVRVAIDLLLLFLQDGLECIISEEEI